MMQFVARFKALRGSEEAYVDSRLPGCKRKKINIVKRKSSPPFSESRRATHHAGGPHA